MGSYRYDSREGGERHFRLIVEPDRGGNLVITGATATPSERGVMIAYTLSKSAAVTLTIRNIAGREVASPIRSQETAAGANTALWNLTSAQGARVPAGTYLVEIVAVAEDGQQARALKSVTIQR